MTTSSWYLVGFIFLCTPLHTIAQCPQSVKIIGSGKLRLKFDLVPDPVPTTYHFQGNDYAISQSGSSGNFTSTANVHPDGNLEIEIGLDIGGTPYDCSYDPDGNLQIPAPVELSLFEGKLIDNDIELIWLTISEVDNAAFEIEHSFDGEHFSIIGMVAGFGNSDVTQQYSFFDPGVRTKALSQTAYYRLVQIDYDGTKTYSDVLAIDLELALEEFEITKITGWDSGERTIKVHFYNPFYIRKVIFYLADINGSIIQVQSIYPESGLNTFEIDLGHNKSPFYFLSLNNGKEIIGEKIALQSDY